MNRVSSYTRKIEYIFSSLDKIETPENEKELYAIFYLIHTSIEASMDICAMLVKDLGGIPGDDYTNIEFLIEKGVLKDNIGEKMKKLNGMRNILVHRYNKIDESLIVDSIDEIKEVLEKFVYGVNNALRKIF